jgi:streptogramin lyase
MYKHATIFIALLGSVTLLFLIPSCSKDNPEVSYPKIFSFSPSSGIIGRNVTITGKNFIPEVPPEEGSGPHINTSIVKFNGIEAEAKYIYQDSINKQRINTTVPEGATTGFITVTAMGNTSFSSTDFIVTTPNYLPNVTVSTASDYGGIDLDIDDDENLYVANNQTYEIVKISPTGSMISLWSSDEISRETPLGIAVDKNGNLYATIDNSIRKITPNGTVSNIAGSSSFGFVDGVGENAKFWFPFGLTVDQDENIYVADLLNSKIRKVTPTGNVTTVAGSSPGYLDGIGSQAQFSYPIDVTLDNDGNLLVADGGRIRKITTNGMVSTVAGNINGFLDGPTNTAQFSGIRGLVVDQLGNIFLCDSGNYCVRKISLDGTVETVAGSIFGYEDGPGHLAKFGQTLGLTINSNGSLFLTQGGGLGKVRKIVID